MEPRIFIENFLARVRALRVQTRILHGIHIVLTYILGSYLTVNLLIWLYPPVHEWAFWVAGLFFTGLGFLVFHYLLRGAFGPFSQDDAALLTESRHPELDNSLINSTQLGRRLEGSQSENEISLELIRELHRRTRPEIEKIDPATVIDRSGLTASRNGLIGVLGSLIIIAIFLPDFLPRGYDRWVNPPEPILAKSGPAEDPTPVRPGAGENRYVMESLGLTFHFPAYTGMATKSIKPSDGKVHVLPGTEVEVDAKTNLPVTGADLVFNGRDHFAMDQKDPANLNGRLLIKEKGFYQFRVRDAEGEKYLLAPKYPVTLEKDRPPSIVIFLANPKPVYFDTGKVQLFYEGKDDFGIASVELVTFVNGKIRRLPVKRFKNREKEAKGDHTWSLAQMDLNPGDEVQYYLEIKDNDNVLGPNTGQSETYTFTLFDSLKEMENLIAMQEEMTEKMIALLATGLVKGASLEKPPANPMLWKQLFISSADSLIEIVNLAQRIHDRGKTIDRFPQPYLNLLKNIISGLTRIRRSQIEAINQIQETLHKPTHASFDSLSPYHAINDRMTGHLENDILFLVKMTNQQKLDQVMGLEEELNELTQTLRDEFEKIKNLENKPRPNELKAKIEQIKRTLQKIMDQLARQTQSMPDEFLNPNAFKSMNMDQFAASLDRMMDLINRGEIDKAMQELQEMVEDLQLLANQFNHAQSDMDDFLDTEIMEVLDDSIKKLDRLEAKQEKLLKETTRINKDLRAQQSKQFEKELEKFFADLKRDVDAIRSLFRENGQFLDEHGVMKQLNELIDKETQVNRRIRELGQMTVDSTLSKDLDRHFQKLNEARRKLSRLTHEKDSLRANEFQRFKEELPRLLEKYDSLKELAQLQDLTEFGNLFKKAYPEVLRWQNNLRTTPNQREDISERMNADLKEATRLNNEISKKLGSMMRSIRKNFDASITGEQKKKLNRMAKEENRMRKETEELARRFERMNQENPMIPPQLSKGMGRSGRHMGRAERNLKEQNIRQSIESENLALKGLRDTRDLLEDTKNANGQMRQAQRQMPKKLGTGRNLDSRRGGSARMRNEKVLLPSEDQYQAPREFREEILNAMKKQTPKDYQRMVMEYYKDLVK
ncbi:hypothetical protein UZ36_05355 [Candidatus Nitromaritima sp. SCGC AAA799-C22]|nr:hypothetical protein UZ36_05355 [Candidatus Nitromaritima sp. SCGC AAA799-C22]